MEIAIISICVGLAIIPGLIDRFRNRIASFLAFLSGAAPLIFMAMYEGKMPLPNNDLSNWIMWPLLVLSCPLLLSSAATFANAKSMKARNAAYVGAIIGALMSLFIWSLLNGSA